MSSDAPNGICKTSQTRGKQPIRAELEPAVSEQLSITRELQSNGQTRQRWSNMNEYSVTVMPISRIKCFQKHLVVYCLAVKWESLWPGSHVEISWGNTKHRPRATFSKAWKQSHEEVQKSSFLPEHLNYNMLKGYYFAQWWQKIFCLLQV